MKAIINRLRRLENAAAPVEREGLVVQAILEARRWRLGESYEATGLLTGSFAGCRTIADRILLSRIIDGAPNCATG